MISPDIIDFFNSFINTLNARQRTIAENLLFDKTYHILKVYDNKKSKLVLKNRFTGDIIDFVTHVKSKCNC
jgi:hypothetical protein